MKKKKEETYQITVIGTIVSLGYSVEDAEKILEALELQARRNECNEGPAILLRGSDRCFIDVKLKTGVHDV